MPLCGPENFIGPITSILPEDLVFILQAQLSYHLLGETSSEQSVLYFCVPKLWPDHIAYKLFLL